VSDGSVESKEEQESFRQ
jgi:hypothetical protein